MRPAYVYAVPGERYALLRGYAGFWCKDNRVPAYRSNMRNGWWLRSERVADVVAGMELAGISVSYSTIGAPRHVPRPPSSEAAA